MKVLSLNGKWRMKRTDKDEWIQVNVPGSVCNDLLEEGIIEDPFYRDNEWKTLDILKNDYEYTREFIIDTDVLQMDKIVLFCKGLDTVTDIYVNYNHIAHTDNMHRTYEFDIKDFLEEGSNNIRIFFESPVQYALKKHEEDPIYKTSDVVDGFYHVRKAHCMYGWDWGPKIPDMGIWRDIGIKAYNTARIEDVYTTQTHENNKVNINFRIKIEYFKNEKIDCYINIISPDGSEYNKVVHNVDDINSIDIEIDNPKLWWPNGYGEQPLYKVEVILKNNQKVLDKKKYKIGLRTLTVKRQKDNWGESFEFEVNGISIFAMGANYIPEDNLLPRCSRERSEKLIQQCVKANFNCIRAWGGGYFPDDYFYDLCDEYGLIVWQDLLFACAVYRMTDEFTDNIIRETEDNIKRLRHHACLGLWCGNNELEWGWTDWDMGFGNDPKLKTDYVKQFEVILPQVAKRVDPNTFYWVASPSSGGGFDNPNDQNRGDVHYWEVWHRLKPFAEYRKYYFRFCSEFGFQSFPCLRTVESFTLPEDRNIFSYVMEQHQKNGSANGRILFYLSDNFKYPTDFDTLLYTSQILQAEAIKYGVEHWRRHRGRCMGAIYWQLNDCWPVASWSSIDYYGRWKALHYYAKRFFAPIMISAEEEQTKVKLALANETFKELKGRVIWKLKNNKGEVLKQGEKNEVIKPLSSKYSMSLDFSDILYNNDKLFTSFLEYYFEIDGEKISMGTVLFTKPKYFKFFDPKLSAKIIEKEDRFVIKVSTENYAKYVEINFNDFDFVLTDNYFDVTSEESVKVELLKKDLSKKIACNELKQAVKLRSAYDIK